MIDAGTVGSMALWQLSKRDGLDVVGIEERPEGVVVRTAQGSWLARTVVIASGSWSTRLRPQLHELLRLQVLGLTWFMPREPEAFAPERFPAFLRDAGPVRESVHHCAYTPDRLPVVDRSERVVTIAELSGHRFKFSPQLSPYAGGGHKAGAQQRPRNEEACLKKPAREGRHQEILRKKPLDPRTERAFTNTPRSYII